MVPGLLDRYVGRTLAFSYLVCSGFLLGLFLIFRILNELHNLLASAAKLPEPYAGNFLFYTVAFYAVELPYMFLQMAPFLTVTAAMFAVSQLMGANEVAPMVFTGRSLHRVLAPVFALAVLSMGAMAGIRELVVPRLHEPREFLQGLVKDGEVDPGPRNGAVFLDDGRTLIIGRYRPRARVMEHVTVHDPAAFAEVVEARRAFWVEDGGEGTGEWRVEEGFLYSGHERVLLRRLDLPPKVTPEFVRLQCRDPAELVDVSYSDLIDLMSRRPNVRQYVVAFHYHLTFPLANLILVLLALPFALRFERGSAVERVFLAVVICGAFLVVDLICRRLGNTGLVHPLTAAWMPTVLFGSMAAAFYDTIRT